MSSVVSTNNTLLEKTMSNATQIVNFALNGKLLANQSDNGRVLMAPVNNSNGGALSLPIILVLIFILASIVGVIVTALFVMRSRFSTWRLDGSKSSPNDLEEAKPVNDKETKADTKIDIKVEAATPEDKEQASPASNSPLINKEVTPENEEAKVQEVVATVVVVKTEDEVVTKTTENANITEVPIVKEVVTSSSSLIVNVLNELSESVATKLESIDPEKEPLKNE